MNSQLPGGFLGRRPFSIFLAKRADLFREHPNKRKIRLIGGLFYKREFQ